ncbi:hypothetical protein GTO10_05620 [Candidatus Saccharibacteria bacterium]|nr:hypothetical protein [Candidatus Saccharibacteria bacterium]
MFGVLRSIVGALAAIAATAFIVPGISYQGDLRVLLAASLVYALFQMLVKPLLNLLTLPLNFLTFGLASAAVGVGLFWAISYFVPSFTFSPFDFPGVALGGIDIPALTVPRYATIILGAFIASVVYALVEQPKRG